MGGGAYDRAREVFVTMPVAAKASASVVIVLVALAATWLVHATGGVQYAFVHLMYVPVILGALAFGLAGGILAGVAGGLLLGPYMPIDTVTGEMQETLNWAYRLMAFTLIGALSGAGAQMFRQYLRTLAWLHEHHADTGLLNLTGLLRQLDRMMAKAPPGQKLIVSITQFTNLLEIQNTFGTAFGSKLLNKVVERAREVVPADALLAQIQPDRIASVVRGEDAARATAQRVDAAIKESYLVDGVPVHLDANIGVAHFPTHARDAEDLLKKAGIAMHWAVNSKSAISLYDDANDRTSRDNLILMGTLPDAIERNELRVWHQAKLNLQTGKVSGTEALLRWQHPQRGLVPPGSFVPQIEETSLINPVTQWVIGAAFADAAEWRRKGHRLRVSVNLSVRNLRDRMLLDVLEENARRHALDPAEIELEITESAVMADPEPCIRLVGLLRERGYGVAIDDFGVGHSSLGYLQKLKVSALKIDQEFIKSLPESPHNQKIVRSILHLADALGLETVAEGVENEQIVELLAQWGCNYAQGYGVHRPAPAADLMQWLGARQAPAQPKTPA